MEESLILNCFKILIFTVTSEKISVLWYLHIITVPIMHVWKVPYCTLVRDDINARDGDQEHAQTGSPSLRRTSREAVDSGDVTTN